MREEYPKEIVGQKLINPETSIFERCLDLYKQGHILPISPVKAFDVSEIEGAFRTLQKGNLIGKAIIKIPSTFPRDLCKLSPRSLTLNPEAAYLIAGGVRGLGKPIALWLVERGARYLTFLSRSVGQSDQDQAFFEELKLCGCMTTTVQGRVENREDVEKAFRQTTKPIKGVIHLAMVTRVSVPLPALSASCTCTMSVADVNWDLFKGCLFA